MDEKFRICQRHICNRKYFRNIKFNWCDTKKIFITICWKASQFPSLWNIIKYENPLLATWKMRTKFYNDSISKQKTRISNSLLPCWTLHSFCEYNFLNLRSKQLEVSMNNMIHVAVRLKESIKYYYFYLLTSIKLSTKLCSKIDQNSFKAEGPIEPFIEI